MIRKTRGGLSGKGGCIYRRERRVLKLTDLVSGGRGRVVNINTREERKLKKFMAMGMMPGVSIVVIQRFPSYVFRIGFTQVTMDFSTASCIEVEVE